jgi:hypothetical protein
MKQRLLLVKNCYKKNNRQPGSFEESSSKKNPKKGKLPSSP